MLRPLNPSEGREIQQELYRIYEAQLGIWFSLLDPDKQRDIIESNRVKQIESIMTHMMECPEITWN